MFQWINDNPYTCPMLMLVQGWVCWQKWNYGCDGWTLLSGPHSRATCQFPVWLIRAECRCWDSWIGCQVRRAAGSDQREYRLKSQQMIDECTLAIDKLTGELRLLIEEVERHGDYDSQFGIGAALDRAWAIVDPSA